MGIEVFFAAIAALFIGFGISHFVVNNQNSAKVHIITSVIRTSIIIASIV